MTVLTAPETEAPVGGAALTVRNLWKVYGPRSGRHLEEVKAGKAPSDGAHTAAVRDVSFDVRPGETFVVMGLSGSGKSTLVRCLNRLLEPTAGKVEIDGLDIVSMPQSQLRELRRKDWAMVFQHFGLLPHRRVLHNVAYGLEVSGVPRGVRDDRAREMIELVGLKGVEHKYPHELSGGMRQRVGLARALAVRPRLLLLDEPFSALDPLIRSDLQDELLRLADVVRQTSIFITHDLAEALKVGDRIAIMRDGEFVQVGTPEDIVLRPADDYVRRFAVEAPRAKVVRAGTIARAAVTLSKSENLEAGLTKLAGAEGGAAIVSGEDGRALSVVTELQLLRARKEGLRTADLLTGEFATVGEDENLGAVMEKLVATGNPVIVRSASGELLGLVDHSAAVAALTTASPSA
ncbi:glycine betaine/L-proline ABC transporter ATP-binding protein [Streptomyces sp. NPDC013978]|uniref:quaternary amine ABC transporter ATP-binding protein n=1 Tax=Streptomyces sp. NPDC013978 TaxID=3364869 RepID=UPI0036FF89D8